MTRLAIEDLDEWRTTFSRLRKGIRSSCRSRPFERLLARCDEIYESGATEGSYSEEDYLTFAEDVLEAAERNAEGAQLPLDLTREHAGVQDFIHSTARFADAAYAALRHPDDWTSANHSVISEMVYSALAWEAKSVAKANNTEDLLDFLERHPAFSAKGGHFHRRSIIRWLVDFELRGNTETLEALSRTFSTDAGIARDLEKAREHHRRISDDPEVPGS